jgi:hypothetical protein
MTEIDTAPIGAPAATISASNSASLGLDLAEAGAKWSEEIKRASKYFAKWNRRCEKIEKIYLAQSASEGSADRSFPMLWANISVLQPAVYARTPVPAVERRFRDADPVARVAAEMIERVLSYQVEKAGFDPLLRQTRDDFLLYARGTCWLRYEADIQASDMPVETSESVADEQAGADDEAGAAQQSPEEKITGERVAVDYVHGSDFLHSPARRWEDVSWVARRVPMTEEDLEARFGAGALAKAKAESATRTQGRTETDRAQSEGKIFVWEIWCKTENCTVWIADGSAEAFEISEPPLDLEDFWPCPRPAYGTTSTGSLIPVPDYVYYAGQVEEIDDLTRRIAKITDQLRLVGFYPSGDGAVSPAIEKAMQPNNDTVMVPIPGWAAFTDKGGTSAISWLPVDMVQKVLIACIEARKQLIDDVYQITGISDIVRGDTQASETATAQRLKSQWGSIRVRDRQSELARFARDIIRISGEIICNLFQPETLVAMSGIQLPSLATKQQLQMQIRESQQQAQIMAQRAQQMGAPPPPAPVPDAKLVEMLQGPALDDVVKLLRGDNVRGFRIDVESDSTIQPDEDAEKQRRIEFVTAVGGLIQQAGPVAQQMPTLVPVIGEFLLFVARGFRTGRQLENTLEQAISETMRAIQNPAPSQPPVQAQLQVQTAKIRAEAEQAKAQATQQTAQMDAQASLLDHQLEMREISARHEHAMQRAAVNAAIANPGILP